MRLKIFSLNKKNSRGPNSRIGNMFFKGYDMLKENSMFKKIPITDFEKSQIRGFKKWLTEFKNRFNSQ